MPNIQVRVEEDLKKQAQEVASALGMEIATAIRIFLCQMVRDRALPFTPSLAPQFIEEHYPDTGLSSSINKEKSFTREEWLRQTVHTGLTALELGDFASDEDVKETFKRAGANVR